MKPLARKKNKFLKLNNISFGFPGKILAKNVFLEIGEGDFIILSGPNGSGKSTLARLLLGVHKPLLGERIDFFQKKAYVPQKSDIDLGYPLTLAELWETAAYEHFFELPFQRKYREILNHEIIKTLALKEKQHLPIFRASGGELQRALIARALIRKADLVVMDEPFSNLDKKARREVSKLLFHLCQKEKTSFFIIDHQGVVRSSGIKFYYLENGILYHDS